MTVLIFKFIGDRTDVAYLQKYYNPLRGLHNLQIGNSDKLENLNSHFLIIFVKSDSTHIHCTCMS